MVNSLRFVAALVAASTLVSFAHAEESPPAAVAPARPRVHHAPRATADAGDDFALEAMVDRPERVRRAVLVVVVGGATREIAFRRAATGPYVAVLPGADVRPPGFAYAIELETVEGERIAVFASREAPHDVQVSEPIADARERALLARLGGRRSVVSITGELAHFGNTDSQITPTGAPGAALTTAKIADQYWRTEAGYTYRMLGTVTEFGIRIGVVRGRSVVPDQPDASKYDVGLNYGAPTVRLRATDWLHVEGELLTSITEVGFSMGGGGAVLLGDPYGAKLTLGFESIQVFGTRGYSRMDLPVTSRVVVAPIVEVTDMPHSSKTGVRLLAEVRADVGGGFQLSARGGYQARDAASGGPGVGLGAAYAF
jgi:hypothetical protein